MDKTMAFLQAFLSFLPRTPKYPLPLPLLTPATQASVMWSLNDIIQKIEKKLNNTHTENEEMIVAVNAIYAIA